MGVMYIGDATLSTMMVLLYVPDELSLLTSRQLRRAAGDYILGRMYCVCVSVCNRFLQARYLKN